MKEKIKKQHIQKIWCKYNNIIIVVNSTYKCSLCQALK